MDAPLLDTVLKHQRRQWLLGAGLRGAVVGGATACALAVVTAASGHGVPGWIWATAGIAGAAAAAWFCRGGAPQRGDAARAMDRHFGLKDLHGSALAFATEVPALAQGYAAATAQRSARWLEDAGADLPSRLPQPRRAPWILAVVAVALGAAMLARVPISPEIARQTAAAAELEKQTTDLNAALTEELERLLEPEEDAAAGLDEAEARQWVASLKPTRDLAEALRQYAALEQRLRAAETALNQPEKQRLLRQAGLALENEARHRQLAQELKDRAYSQAAESLKRMDPSAMDLAAPTAARTQLQPLRTAAQRMASAVRRDSPKTAASEPPRDPLEESLLGLEQATQRLNDALGREAEKKPLQTGQSRPRDAQPPASSASNCAACQSQTSQALSDLQRQLQQLQRDQNAARRLNRLRQALSQCQSCLQPGGEKDSAAQALARMLNPQSSSGKPGTGSVESRRLGREALPQTQQTLELQGRSGDGPAEHSVEQSDQGSGVTTRVAGEKKREYQQQAESFIQRQDIPAPVREGVKRYFESLQPAEVDPAAQPPPPLPSTPPPPDRPTATDRPGRV